MALRYVARYATSTAKLRDYLKRKLRERGWSEDFAPDVEALVLRHERAGHVDDKSYAKIRSESLLRRGYGVRRVSQSLFYAGIGSELQDSLRPTDHAQRQAVLALAKRRRFGPFGAGELTPEKRDKQLAAILRAGHAMDHARKVLHAASEEEAQSWADEGADEGEGSSGSFASDWEDGGGWEE